MAMSIASYPCTASYPDLAGQVAVVTGGSRGIGAETCLGLAANGVKVAVCGRDQSAADKVTADIRDSGGQAITVIADCTDISALAAARENVEAELGPVDILAAFAGGDGGPVPLAQLSQQDWRDCVEQNLTSAFLTLQAFVPGMCARGAGSVITMSSAAGRQPGWSSPGYAAAKAGVVMLTRHVAREVGPSGVRVNCVAPSLILNERNEAKIPAETRPQVAQQFAIRRLGIPADVTAAALFLASASASWITGQVIDVGGGKVMV
jgi:3-oxoacyl-[acyl-carrier protein] reductase